MRRHVRTMDWVFYLFAGSLLLLGLTRVFFPGYLEALFRSFFGFSTIQKKKGEGTSRYGVASLWLNFLFFWNGGIFLYFLFLPAGPNPLSWQPWQWIGFWMFLLGAVYLVKLAFLMLTGWVFGKVQLAQDYMSVVFQVNRMAATLLLLSALSIALSDEAGRQAFLPFVWLMLSAVIAIRLVRAFEFFRKSLRIGLLQFLVLCLSFEALPLLLLRKALWDLFL
jgi:hypothetical protein